MKIYFLGASNPETIRMIRSSESMIPSFSVGGFLDNDISKHGRNFYGYPILGGTEYIDNLDLDNSRFVNLITQSAVIRHQTTKELIKKGAVLENFIHHNVNLTMVTMGTGNYIQESVILQAGVQIGTNCSIHMASLIGHETIIMDDVFIAHGVSISGCCNIGQGCLIGTNSTIYPRVTIGEWSIISAGTIVRKNIPPYSLVAGNPAKVIKKIQLPKNILEVKS